MRYCGALVLLVACAAPIEGRQSAWDESRYAAITALIQSCVGDLSAVPALLTPGGNRRDMATHQAFAGSGDGCNALASLFGIVVTQDAACAPACSGDVAITCSPEFRTTTQCQLFGGTCRSVDGTPTCVDQPGSPTPDGAITCPTPATPTCADSDTWQLCGAASAVRVSCASRLAGSTCVNGACVLGSECVPGKFLDGLACDGKSLRVCVAGRMDLVDCPALGFTGCDPFTRGCTPNPLVAP